MELKRFSKRITRGGGPDFDEETVTLYGYKSGENVLVKPIFYVAREFSEGFAFCGYYWWPIEDKEELTYYFIDEKGKDLISSNKWQDATDFKYGFSVVTFKNKSIQLLDKYGKFVTKPVESIEEMHQKIESNILELVFKYGAGVIHYTSDEFKYNINMNDIKDAIHCYLLNQCEKCSEEEYQNIVNNEKMLLKKITKTIQTRKDKETYISNAIDNI